MKCQSKNSEFSQIFFAFIDAKLLYNIGKIFSPSIILNIRIVVYVDKVAKLHTLKTKNLNQTFLIDFDQMYIFLVTIKSSDFIG